MLAADRNSVSHNVTVRQLINNTTEPCEFRAVSNCRARNLIKTEAVNQFYTDTYVRTRLIDTFGYTLLRILKIVIFYAQIRIIPVQGAANIRIIPNEMLDMADRHATSPGIVCSANTRL